MSEVKAICNAHCFNATLQHSMKRNTTLSSKKGSLKVFTFHNSLCFNFTLWCGVTISNPFTYFLGISLYNGTNRFWKSYGRNRVENMHNRLPSLLKACIKVEWGVKKTIPLPAEEGVFYTLQTQTGIL